MSAKRFTATLTYFSFVFTILITILLAVSLIIIFFMTKALPPLIILSIIIFAFCLLGKYFYRAIKFIQGKISDENRIKRLKKTNFLLTIIMGFMAGNFGLMFFASILIFRLYDLGVYYLGFCLFFLPYAINTILLMKLFNSKV